MSTKTKTAKIKVVVSSTWPRCGHCVTGHHQSCSVGTFQSGPPDKHPDGAVILCSCEEGGCTPGRRKCLDCGNRRTEEVSPFNWKCLDRDACAISIQTRRDADPQLARIREAREKATMAKTEAAAKKAATTKKTAAPKVGKCLVTGQPTKGGLFLPGMDARYASERVASVMDGSSTKKQALEKMKADKVSDKLIAKFEKNLTIAQEKKAKKDAAAKAKADEKKAASKGK